MTQLPVQLAWRLADRPEQQSGLADGLWSQEAVGIIGGDPKCGKSFLALDLAVAVAAGIPCLRRFAVSRPGRVLLFPAEDALHIVRRRLDGICAAAGISLAELDVLVITAPSLRLDLEVDRASLDETVARLQPRLLVLDPFVRLHRIDENASGEVAPVLAFLRELQRRHAIAVVLVHHARKGAGTIRAGQALRGSSEFHAWGDSNLYLRRDSDDHIVLTVEHRAAAAMQAVTLQLAQRDNALALELVWPDRQLERPAAPTSVEHRAAAAMQAVTLQLAQRDNALALELVWPDRQLERPAAPTSVDQPITAALTERRQPRPFAELRTSCHVRTTTLYQRLAAMIADGIVVKSADGHSLSAH